LHKASGWCEQRKAFARTLTGVDVKSHLTGKIKYCMVTTAFIFMQNKTKYTLIGIPEIETMAHYSRRASIRLAYATIPSRNPYKHRKYKY